MEIIFFTVRASIDILLLLISVPFRIIYDVFSDFVRLGVRNFTPSVIRKAAKKAYKEYKEEKKKIKDNYKEKKRRNKETYFQRLTHR